MERKETAMHLNKPLAKLNAQIQALQRRAEALRIDGRKTAIAEIVQQMRDFQIAPKELIDAYRGSKPVGRLSPKTAAKAPVRRPVAPKYRHPGSGETWSGRGRAPRWLSAEEKTGASREQFRV